MVIEGVTEASDGGGSDQTPAESLTKAALHRGRSRCEQVCNRVWSSLSGKKNHLRCSKPAVVEYGTVSLSSYTPHTRLTRFLHASYTPLTRPVMIGLTRDG
jgi:hypothetical protein